MCANIGVDPLASNKGMWAQLLGFGDFYYELGVQIVEACLATRTYNGGFMELGALRNAVQVKISRAPQGTSTAVGLKFWSQHCIMVQSAVKHIEVQHPCMHCKCYTLTPVF